MISQWKRRGLSTLHLLGVIIAVVVIVFMLFGAVFLFVLRQRENARNSTCASNIRQMALALHNYESARGNFPFQNYYVGDTPGSVTVNNVPGAISGGMGKEASYSFITQLLPQFEEGELHASIDFTKNPFTSPNGQLSCTAMPVLQCPNYSGSPETIAQEYTSYSNPDWQAPKKPILTQYVAMGATTRENLYQTAEATTVEPDGFLFSGANSKGPIRDGSIADGMAKTIMLAETREEKYAAWMDGTTASLFGMTATGQTTLNRQTPYIAAADFGGAEDWQWGPSSMHPGMAHHAFGDGAVRSISDDIQPNVYRAFITRASRILNGISDADQVESFFNGGGGSEEGDMYIAQSKTRSARSAVKKSDGGL